MMKKISERGETTYDIPGCVGKTHKGYPYFINKNVAKFFCEDNGLDDNISIEIIEASELYCKLIKQKGRDRRKREKRFLKECERNNFDFYDKNIAYRITGFCDKCNNNILLLYTPDEKGKPEEYLTQCLCSKE